MKETWQDPGRWTIITLLATLLACAGLTSCVSLDLVTGLLSFSLRRMWLMAALGRSLTMCHCTLKHPDHLSCMVVVSMSVSECETVLLSVSSVSVSVSDEC